MSVVSRNATPPGARVEISGKAVGATPAAGNLPLENPSNNEGDAGVDPDTVLREAQNAYLNGDFQRAIDLALPVKSISASAATRAWRIIGAAGCNLGDLKRVGDAYRHLDSNARQFIIYVCQRGGVVFTGGQFKFEDASTERRTKEESYNSYDPPQDQHSNDIEAALRRVQTKVQTCGPRGTYEVRLTIEADGSVRDASMLSKSSDSIAQCVIREIKQTLFPEPMDGKKSKRWVFEITK